MLKIEVVQHISEPVNNTGKIKQPVPRPVYKDHSRTTQRSGRFRQVRFFSTLHGKWSQEKK